MKAWILAVFLSAPLLAVELHDEKILIRVNGDIESIDLSQQPPETRRILHKLAYKQYLSHNQWACFKAALLACTITTAASLITVWYANK